jgi:putative tryptophan/tyrosine transport system substrate-binding protein
MNRRNLMTLLGGAAVWPVAARAQQPDRVRRVAVLMAGAENDPLYQDNVSLLRKGLQQLGWIEGRNLKFDIRFGGDDKDQIRSRAEELAGLAPDVIVVNGGVPTREVEQLTKTIPIVFEAVGDPVINGVVAGIARPGINATGFTNLFPSIGSKWLELLKEVAPHLTRVLLIFDPDQSSPEGYFTSIDAAAAVLDVETIRTPARNSSEIERAINAFAVEPNGGLIFVPPPPTYSIRELVFRLALQRRLPTITVRKEQITEGCLMSYGPNRVDQYQGVASYVDRILRGAKPAVAQAAAPTLGLRVAVLKATNPGEIDAAFESLSRERGTALVVSADTFFLSQREQFVALAIRHSIPVLYTYRELVEAGGLMSYGPSLSESRRLLGVYAGRILKGEKPADLPVQQSTKIELVINLKTAKALSITVPPSLLAIADEVIE